jgi:hypothetical protein
VAFAVFGGVTRPCCPVGDVVVDPAAAAAALFLAFSAVDATAELANVAGAAIGGGTGIAGALGGLNNVPMTRTPYFNLK